MHGCFVTGTDTGVGKTIVSAALVAALRQGGIDARGLKPVITGTDHPSDPDWPSDPDLLATVSAATREATTFAAYAPAVSPHLAAALADRPLEVGSLVARIRDAAEHHTVVVEGVGGLCVPLTDHVMVADLAAALGLPVVVVARAGLGTINHTLLTLAYARERGLEVAGVVLNQWPARPCPMHESNRKTIARLGMVEVATVPAIEGPHPATLAAVGADLPLARWLREPALVVQKAPHASVDVDINADRARPKSDPTPL